MVQVLFPNNDAIFQDDDTPIHSQNCSVFEEHEDALHHILWLAQSPKLNIIEPLWSVLESRMRSRFPPLSHKQLQEEWCSIPLETLQNLYESILSRTQSVLQASNGSTPYK